MKPDEAKLPLLLRPVLILPCSHAKVQSLKQLMVLNPCCGGQIAERMSKVRSELLEDSIAVGS